jgi:hypothetical protein
MLFNRQRNETFDFSTNWPSLFHIYSEQTHFDYARGLDLHEQTSYFVTITLRASSVSTKIWSVLYKEKGGGMKPQNLLLRIRLNSFWVDEFDKNWVNPLKVSSNECVLLEFGFSGYIH